MLLSALTHSKPPMHSSGPVAICHLPAATVRGCWVQFSYGFPMFSYGFPTLSALGRWPFPICRPPPVKSAQSSFPMVFPCFPMVFLHFPLWAGGHFQFAGRPLRVLSPLFLWFSFVFLWFSYTFRSVVKQIPAKAPPHTSWPKIEFPSKECSKESYPKMTSSIFDFSTTL